MGSCDTFVLRTNRKESRRQGLVQNRRQKQQSRRNVKARKRTENKNIILVPGVASLSLTPRRQRVHRGSSEVQWGERSYYYLTS